MSLEIAKYPLEGKIAPIWETLVYSNKRKGKVLSQDKPNSQYMKRKDKVKFIAYFKQCGTSSEKKPPATLILDFEQVGSSGIDDLSEV